MSLKQVEFILRFKLVNTHANCYESDWYIREFVIQGKK